MTRIGIGYDIHRLVQGRKLFLGGVEIPYVLGLLGHSDADALLHALCDALLGALGSGDIGEHFPNTDPEYHNVSSVLLTQKVVSLVRERGFVIVNIDSVIIAQEPVRQGAGRGRRLRPSIRLAATRSLFASCVTRTFTRSSRRCRTG